MTRDPLIGDPSPALPELLSERLLERARRHPERVALRVLGDGDHVTTELTYHALWARACAVAEALTALVPRGSRALVVHGNDDHYLVAFLGCLAAGVIAVPVFPPAPREMA